MGQKGKGRERVEREGQDRACWHISAALFLPSLHLGHLAVVTMLLWGTLALLYTYHSSLAVDLPTLALTSCLTIFSGCHAPGFVSLIAFPFPLGAGHHAS